MKNIIKFNIFIADRKTGDVPDPPGIFRERGDAV